MSTAEEILSSIQADYVPPDATSANGNAKHADAEPEVVFGPECRLPESFWNVETDGTLGENLRHQRAAAHAAQRCPTAAFGVGLARTAAGLPHTVKIDGIVGSEQPLTLFVATLGRSGGGKGDAAAIATRNFPASNLPLLIDGVTDHLPPGSGQGLVDVLFEMVEERIEGRTKPLVRKVQRYHNAFFEMDEGEALSALAGQSSSILLETLRTIWSGKTVGQVNVEAERRRVLPAGTYTYGVNIQVQPSKAAQLIGDDLGGTPQRFLWFPTQDPDIPPATGERLGPMNWSPPGVLELAPIAVMPGSEGGYVRHYLTQDTAIAEEIRAYDLGVQRGEIKLAPLDSHALNLRRRVAAILALWDGKLHTELIHWELSNTVMEVSNATRAVVLGATRAEAAAKADKDRKFKASVAVASALASNEALERQRIVNCAEKIAKKVRAAPDRWRYSTMRKSLTSNDKGVYHEAIEHAVAMEWIIIIEAAGQGTNKRLLRPGPKKP